jgi:phosphoribosylaminoimidazolecarboxamide formyltransferase/IMP cyclohydrolase
MFAPGGRRKVMPPVPVRTEIPVSGLQSCFGSVYLTRETDPCVTMSDILPIKRALLSVSDKSGLVSFARALAARGVEILSTGGSAKALREANVPVTEVADHTGFPEILDGRVKTLVPQIHGGILGRRDNAKHVAQMAAHHIAPIDLVAVNLYPFEATVAVGAPDADCVENIDIGGPALIRAAAKNHDFVAVLTEPDQYDAVLAELETDGGTTLTLRRRLAGEAYARTAAYDAAIAAWFADRRDTPGTGTITEFPRRLTIGGTLRQTLRYGENPHQQAGFYVNGTRPGVATARQVQGKELSYNNLADTDAAFECVAEFAAPTVAIIKHANPCGVASALSLADAWDLAFRCDPISPFGGIVAVNRPLDAAAAEKIAAILTEVIVAPDASDAGKAVVARRKNLRLLLTGGMPDPTAPGWTFRSLAGGFLAQTRDNGRIGLADLRVVTKRAPTDAEVADLLFAFTVCKHVKSNAIVYAKDGATVGIGSGQPNRVDSARIAAWKSEEAAKAAGLPGRLTDGSVVASDAFFPFADGLEAAASAGATAVIQPGGSIRDAEVIAAADATGLAMVFTGMRHFRH